MTTTNEEQKNETNEPPKGDDAKGSAEEGKRVSLFVSLTMGPEESDHADPGSDVPIARGEVSLFIPGGDFAGAMFAALPKLVEVASQGRVRVAPVGEHFPGCPNAPAKPPIDSLDPAVALDAILKSLRAQLMQIGRDLEFCATRLDSLRKEAPPS